MIAAIMPCRGRAEQTVTNVRRLLATAGVSNWGMLIVVDDDPDVSAILQRELEDVHQTLIIDRVPAGGYWRCLEAAQSYTDAPLLANLANDLWACDNWLSEALAEYREHFGDGDGLLGFAGDGHAPHHSCHFLISRRLLDKYGGWPTWYHHNFGDRELCARAQADGRYAKAERAYVEHCHVERGLAPDDAVYQAGRANYRQDEALFAQRRRDGWPPVSQ
jgi:hypothetical protein